MPKRFTTRVARGHIDNYDGQTLGVIVVTDDGASAATADVATVADIVGEIDTADAPGYTQSAMDVVFDPDLGLLKRDPLFTVPAVDLDGAAAVGGVWFVAHPITSGSEAIAFLEYATYEPGTVDWDIDPADGIAVVDDTADLTLDELTDVDVSTAADGDALVFNGTSWVPEAGGGGGGTDATTSITESDPTLLKSAEAVARWEAFAPLLSVPAAVEDGISDLIPSLITEAGTDQKEANRNIESALLAALGLGGVAVFVNVPSSRLVSAGTGLTGGGDLTADRTLAVDFGTTSGKVTQGNDSRLSDARTPTAHKTSHATGGTDALAPSDIGAVPTSRTFAGLDLSADRTVADVLAALGIWMPWRAVSGRYTHTHVRTGAGTHNASRCYYVPIWLPSQVTVDRIGVFHESVSTTTGGYRVGLYSATSAGLPGSLLVDAGVIDLSGSTGALRYQPGALSQAVGPGLFYVAAARQTTGSAPSVSLGNPIHPAPSTDNTSNGFFYEDSVSSGLPSTATPASTSNSQAPVLSIRIA